MLKKEKEREMFQEYQAAEDEGKKRELEEKILNYNQDFICRTAKHYYRSCSRLDLKDLVQAGNIGLLRAIRKYDMDGGSAFLGYARFYVSAEIRKEIWKMEPSLYVPSNIGAELYYTMEEIAKEQRIATHELEKWEVLAIAENYLQNNKKIEGREYLISLMLNLIADDMGNIPLSKEILDEFEEEQVLDLTNEMEKVEQEIDIKKFLKRMKNILTEREYLVMSLRLGRLGGLIESSITFQGKEYHISEEELTSEQIGKLLRVTRERVRQIEAKAARKLKYVYCIDTLINKQEKMQEIDKDDAFER